LGFSETARYKAVAGVAAVVIIAAEEHLTGFLRAGIGIGHHDDRFLFAEFHGFLLVSKVGLQVAAAASAAAATRTPI
jgi:hypothetical protein